MQASVKTTDIIKHADPYVEQDLLFTYYKEEKGNDGNCTGRELTREVLIDYIGIKNSLHRYQICCNTCDIETTRSVDLTSELFIAIDFVFTLVVVSANEKGNLIELHNFPFLQQEWLDLRESLIQDYDQNDAANWALINDMDIMMQDDRSVLNYIKSPDMYGLFFNGYWKENNDGHTKPSFNKVQYGKELQYITMEEVTHTKILESGTQQFVHIDIKNSDPARCSTLIGYSGTCTYIDGALNFCQKKIDLGSTKFNYSVRWVGLKKRFQS